MHLQSLSASISDERLSRYSVACHGNVAEAISLYEYNCRVSEAFYTAIQGFEICLRNHLHRALSGHFGKDWMFDRKVPLDGKARLKIAHVIERLHSRGKSGAVGQIVAELSLGFWVALLTKRYDMPLWRICTHTCFSANGKRLGRFSVHERCYGISQFRNRVAHYEPIWDQDLLSRHQEIIEAIGWMCGETALWVSRRSRVPAIASDQ